MILDFLDHLETVRAQQRPHPQRPPRRHPLLHALRRRARSGVPADHRPGCWPYPPSGSTGRCSATSPAEQIAAILAAPDRTHLERATRRRPARRRLQHRRPRLGADRPAGPRRAARTARAPCTCTARAASSASSRCGPAPPPNCAPGCDQTQRRHPSRRCSPTANGDADDPLGGARPARPCRRGRRAELPVAARPARLAAHPAALDGQSTCLSRARTWPSSPSGSGTPARPSRTNTSKPTWCPRSFGMMT